MKKSIVLSVIVMIGVFITIGYLTDPYIKDLGLESVKSEAEYSNNEIILKKFIDEKLSDDKGGIYTNFKEEKSEGEITKGHNILSESQGMMLQYYLYSGDSEGFEKTYKYIKENMSLKDKLISWRVSPTEKSPVSATIDDLRIAKNLIIGEDEFNKFKYRYYGVQISEAVYSNLLDNDVLIDFKDETGKSKISTLCYLDLQALKILSKTNIKWSKIYDKSLEIINNGYINDELPLYKKFYNTETKEYDDEEIDTLLSLNVILNRAEANEDVTTSVNWLKSNLKIKGYISSKYNARDNSENKFESTAIYALIGQIAKVVNDDELYRLAIEKMKLFQVMNTKSNIYGSFGNEKTEDVFSYDNLNALLAFRKR